MKLDADTYRQLDQECRAAVDWWLFDHGIVVSRCSSFDVEDGRLTAQIVVLDGRGRVVADESGERPKTQTIDCAIVAAFPACVAELLGS